MPIFVLFSRQSPLSFYTGSLPTQGKVGKVFLGKIQGNITGFCGSFVAKEKIREGNVWDIGNIC